jgi:coenzyme F420-reducing hydrogenase alpha subunit
MFWEVKPKRSDNQPYKGSNKIQKMQKKEEIEDLDSEEEHTNPEEYMKRNKYSTRLNNRRNKQRIGSYQNKRNEEENSASTDQEKNRPRKEAGNIRKTQEQASDMENILGQILERLEKLEIAEERAWKAQPDRS